MLAIVVIISMPDVSTTVAEHNDAPGRPNFAETEPMRQNVHDRDQWQPIKRMLPGHDVPLQRDRKQICILCVI